MEEEDLHQLIELLPHIGPTWLSYSMIWLETDLKAIEAEANLCSSRVMAILTICERLLSLPVHQLGAVRHVLSDQALSLLVVFLVNLVLDPDCYSCYQ